MSKRKKYQNSLGNELATLLKPHGWEISSSNETFFLRKDYNDVVWFFGFHFYNQKIYKILTFENISFPILSNIVKNKFKDILDDEFLVVGFRTISEHVEVSDIFIDLTVEPIRYAKILAERILEAEKTIYQKYSDEGLVLQSNLSSRHWEWLTPPFLPYVLFMVAYAEKYNEPSLIQKAYYKVEELRPIFKEGFNGELNKIDKIFEKLGY